MNIWKIEINIRDLLSRKWTSMYTHTICTEVQEFLDPLMKLTYRLFDLEISTLDHQTLYWPWHQHWNDDRSLEEWRKPMEKQDVDLGYQDMERQQLKEISCNP